MTHPRVRYGAALLALLALSDIVGSLLTPPPPDAPPGANAIGVGLGVLTLLALALWYRSRTSPSGGRAGLWVAVVLRVVAGVFPIIGIAEFPVPMAVLSIVLLLVTVAAVVLVGPALVRGPGVPGQPDPGSGRDRVTLM